MSKHRARDLALEVLVGLCIVGAIIACAQFDVPVWMPGLKWWGLAGETAAIFGYAVRAMRRYWKVARFWAGFLVFLAIHLAVCAVVLLRVEHFGLLWFVFIGYGEWVALAYLLDFLLRDAVGIISRHRHKTLR